MNRQERFESPQDAMLAALSGWQADMWTAIPGIIESFDPANDTCSVQPAIKALLTSPETGKQTWETLPLLINCPVYFPSGGGCTLTFPVAQGDECLVVFSSRCIDAWWQSGGVQQQAELRMHDLSDGFVYVGFRSQPKKLTVSTSSVQIRTDDGSAYVEINSSSKNIAAVTSGSISASAGGNAAVSAGGNVTASAGGNMEATASGSVSITAPTIELNGNVMINGAIAQTGGGTATLSGDLVTTGEVTANGIPLSTHVHGGVQTGAGVSGGPQ